MSLTLPFGVLLRQVRKRAGMTQRDLAAALGYSDSLVSSLETAQRQPDLEAVIQRFVPALGLQGDPALAARLIEAAAAARGEQLPAQYRNAAPHALARAAGTQGRHSVPALPIQVIGRGESIQQIGNRLLGHGGRLLTLIGPPGVGKTTLALAVVAHIEHHYREGACFVPLAPVSEPLWMAATILATVAPGDTSPQPPQNRLIERLRRQSLLLVLDNLEQIDGASSLIATLLAECPGVTVLATSRERLHLRAEQRFSVPPLALAPAVELFVQRAQTVDGDFRHTEHNGSTLAAICTRLDCLPLALELCAAQVEIFTSAQLLVQLQDHSLDMLVDGALDLPPHQRTLRAAIQYSYDLLSTEEQALFRRLGVFVGGVDLAAVKEIGDWGFGNVSLQSPIPILRSLIAKSLVGVKTTTTGEQRFSLLETIREFALEKLRLQGEEESARQRHYLFYLHLFRGADYHLRGREVAACFARLLPEYDNLRAAIQWALHATHYEETAWLLVASSWYCRLRGHWYEEQGWLQELLPHRKLLTLELRLALLLCFCSLARSPEEIATINDYADELVALAEDSTSKVLCAGVWHFLAKATPGFAQAANAWERSILLAHEAAQTPTLGPEFGVASDPLFVLGGALDFYANRLIAQGAFAQATPLIEEALAVSVKRGFRSGIGAELSNLGLLALLQGNLAQARTHLSKALTITTTNIFPAVHAKTKTLLGLVTLYHNNTTEALRLLQESLELWTDIRDTPYLAIVAIYLAETALWERRPAEAEQWLTQVLRYHVDPRWLGIAVVNCLFVAARLAVARREYVHAAMLLGLAEETRLRTHCTLVKPVRTQVDAALAAVQAALGSAALEEAFAAGREMEFEEVYGIIRTYAEYDRIDATIV